MPMTSPHPNDCEQDEDTSLRATYAGTKRRIATLESQLLALQEAGQTKKTDIISTVAQGRVLSRIVSLFEPLERLVEENDRRRALELDELEAEEDELSQPVPPSLDQDRMYRGYGLLVQHISSIERKLLELDAAQLGICFRDLKKGAGSARGDDAANLKPAAASWIGALFDPSHSYAPVSPTNKSERGFEHEVTGRLICPVEYDWDDLEIRQKIRDGDEEYVVTGDSWPAFLFPHAKADPDHIEEGMFRSVLLLKAYKYIFTSPTSAQDIETEIDLEDLTSRPSKRSRRNRAPTRGHVAHLMGVKSVTPRSLAYVAVQLRFSLSNANAWQENDGCFNYHQFYNNIVDFFELPPGPATLKATRDLLTWWSSKVFGKHTISVPAGSRANSSVAKLAAQRAARERRAESAT